VCLAADVTGKVVRLVGAVQDITEAMEAEEKRNTLEDQLRQAQKLEAIGTLASGIAHDFNNILGIILTNVDLAQTDLPSDLPEDHGTIESLREIKAAGYRARDLVRQILTFSRRGETQLAVMKVQPIVHECLQMLASTIPAMVTLRKSIDPACPCIIGDPTQLHQVMMNLCTNAWHALPERDGVIDVKVEHIEASKAPLEAQLDASVTRFVRIAVSDNGHGMDAKTQARIFEPFFTTKAAGKGTGLGLAVVHGIVKSHGGAITLESAPGQGTTFTLYFPAQDSELETTTTDKEPSSPGRGERVMLVDDDVSMGRAMQRFLARQGYRVDLFHTPQAALEAFAEHAAGFDLVVTDYSMPGMTGLDLTSSLKQIKPQLPVLLVTGSMRFAEQHQLELSGIHEFLAKPVAPERLTAAIARALAERPPAAPPPAEPRTRPTTILLIDDDDKFRGASLRMLQHAGYAVLGAREGNQALSLMRGTPVDVVLTDVLMPGTDGLETILQIQRQFPGMRIIAMSGGGTISAADCLAMCQKLGVAVTLRKPFTQEDLLGAIIEALHTAGSPNGTGNSGFTAAPHT
jgi:signal transduction histidine kinase/CheY-like chemotaxis protein